MLLMRSLLSRSHWGDHDVRRKWSPMRRSVWRQLFGQFVHILMTILRSFFSSCTSTNIRMHSLFGIHQESFKVVAFLWKKKSNIKEMDAETDVWLNTFAKHLKMCQESYIFLWYLLCCWFFFILLHSSLHVSSFFHVHATVCFAVTVLYMEFNKKKS